MTEMKTRRWMKSVLAEAAVCTAQLPWARGDHRDEMIAGRDAQTQNDAPCRTQRRA